MSTRKLIAMAMACLVAVIVAGVVKLAQINDGDAKVEVLHFGDSAVVGEMNVTVVSLRTTSTQTIVQVKMGGVEDADGAASWRLLADGKLFSPVVGMEENQCGATTTEVVQCSLVFDAVGAGTSVAYSRAGEQRNWSD